MLIRAYFGLRAKVPVDKKFCLRCEIKSEDRNLKGLEMTTNVGEC
jgi:hypothetical protein